MMDSQKTLTNSTGTTFPSPEYFKKMKENYETGKIIYIHRRQGGIKPMGTMIPSRIAPSTVMNSIRSSSYVTDPSKDVQAPTKYVLRIPKPPSSSLLTSSNYDENTSGVYVPAIEPVRMQCLTVPLSMSMGGEYPYEEIEEDVVEDDMKKEIESLSPSSSQVSLKSEPLEEEERKYPHHMIPLHNRLQPSRYTCVQPDCYYKGSSEIALRKHMAIHKTPVVYGGLKQNEAMRMPVVQPKPKGVKCSECETFAYSRPLLLRHMLDAHGIEAPLVRKTFINRESLQKWLDGLRETHAVEFVVSSGSKKWGRGLQVHYLTCSRSGDQKERPNKKYVRPPRPSIKCGRNCMAYLKIKQNPTVSELQIEGCLHHSGHDIDHTRVVLEHNELDSIGRIVELVADTGLEISIENIDQFRDILGCSGRFRLITDMGIISQMPVWIDQYRKSFFATSNSVHGQQMFRKTTYGKSQLMQRDVTTSASLLGRRTMQSISTRRNDLSLRYHPIQINRPQMRVVKPEPCDFESGPLTLSDVFGCSSNTEPTFSLQNVKQEIDDEDAAAVAAMMKDDLKQEDDAFGSPMIGGDDNGINEDVYRSFMDFGDDLPTGLSDICPTLGHLFGDSDELEDLTLAQFSMDQELLGPLGPSSFDHTGLDEDEEKFLK